MKVQAVVGAVISPAQRIQVAGFLRPWARVCRSMRQVYVGHTGESETGLVHPQAVAGFDD